MCVIVCVCEAETERDREKGREKCREKYIYSTNRIPEHPQRLTIPRKTKCFPRKANPRKILRKNPKKFPKIFLKKFPKNFPKKINGQTFLEPSQILPSFRRLWPPPCLYEGRLVRTCTYTSCVPQTSLLQQK